MEWVVRSWVPRTQQGLALGLSVWPQTQPSSALEQCTTVEGWPDASSSDWGERGSHLQMETF